MISAKQALKRLQEGNRRFVTDLNQPGGKSGSVKQMELVEEHMPFAIVLGCSDARVPAEIVFNQGLGDLFVIRVAGNIVAPSQIGSIEFAATQFGTRLVVVMGHSQCGAILTTINQLKMSEESQSRNLRAIVDRVKPSIVDLINNNEDLDHETLVERAVRANVASSVEQLQHGSDILEELIRDQGLLIVGAEYSLATGAVEFFHNV